MRLSRSSLLLAVTLIVPVVAGCSGEDKPDPVAEESQRQQRGAARPGGAPPGFPVPGETANTAPGTAAGTNAR